MDLEFCLPEIQIAVNLTVQSQAEPPEVVNPGFEDDGGFFNVATGWSSFGGTKWEGVWDTQRVWTQGVSEIAAGGECGVYQTIDVTSGVIYRVSVYGLSQATDYDFSIGVDPAGGTSPASATFGSTSNSSTWSQVTADFNATGSTATIFLRGRNVGTL